MTAREFLTECAERDVIIRAEAGMLLIDAPAGLVDPAMLDRIREQKVQLMWELAPHPPCRCHRKQRWWFSRIGKHWTCDICHSPVSADVALGWIDSDPV